MQITAEERRARLTHRHLLAHPERAGSPEAVADALVGLHATDAATVFLAVAARIREPSPEAVEQALYQDLSLVRLLAMRRTMFVVGRDLAPVVDAAAARPVAAKERKGLLRYLTDGGRDGAWLVGTERQVLAALADGVPRSGTELAAEVPALGTQVTVGAGTRHEAVQTVASRVLRVLAAENRIRRDRPRGSWTSSQFRWVLGEPLPELDPAPARAELARHWLARYGPGTEADLAWWTGWTLRDVRAALAAIGAQQVHLDEGPGLVLPDDTEPTPAAAPCAALLPALDPSGMGWRQRDWYLPPRHTAELFDRTGNIGPTVWWDGRIVGGWAQRDSGEPVWEFLDDVGAEAVAAVTAEAERLAGFLGGIRVTPRFRTPLERRLSEG